MAKLQIQNLTKTYEPVRALDAVSFDVQEGSIHALLGENGAGKSTLVSILGGFTVPDSGRVLLDDQPLSFGSPKEAKRAGIEMVHQHFMLVPQFTVLENLALVRGRRESGKALEIAEQLGWSFEPNRRVGDLSVGSQQRLEIVKALSGDPEILILDEPTAVLSRGEVEDLFSILRKLKEGGKTILLIAHKLKEVLSIADEVTVLRKGKLVASAAAREVDERHLAQWMVGEMPVLASRTAPQAGEVVLLARELVVQGDRGERAVDGVSLNVAAGEIFGIGGVDGNGQVELAGALARARKFKSGTIESEDEPTYIPQDRQAEGLAMRMSIEDNLLITGHRKQALGWSIFLFPKRAKAWARELVKRFNIAVSRTSDPVGTLSGGSQQKVVVARTLADQRKLLIASNPTRGLDVQATSYVHEAILEAARAGTAVVLFSTDLDELRSLADRTVFMSGGKFVEGLDAAAMLGGA